MRPYHQRRIYLSLRTLPKSARELCLELGIPIQEDANVPTRPVTDALLEMRKAGLVRMQRPRAQRHPKFEVVPGTVAPKDKRGYAEGTLLTLSAWGPINMAKLNLRRGYHPRPIAKTALEQCWGWLPSDYSACEPESDVVYSSGEVASAETVTPA